MRKLTNKKIAALAVAAVALTGTGVAYAYWTSTGSGDGSATAMASNGDLNDKLSADLDATSLAPGKSTAVTFAATNPSETTLWVGDLDVAVATDDSACDPAWFALGTAAGTSTQTITQNHPIPTGGAALPNGTTLYFLNSSTEDQEACKGAVITLELTADDPNA